MLHLREALPSQGFDCRPAGADESEATMVRTGYRRCGGTAAVVFFTAFSREQR